MFLLALVTMVAGSKEMKAQAQGFLFLAGFGLGLLVGNYVNGLLIDAHTTFGEAGEKIYDWQPIWTITTICSAVLFFVFLLLFHDNPQAESPAATEEDAAKDDAKDEG